MGDLLPVETILKACIKRKCFPAVDHWYKGAMLALWMACGVAADSRGESDFVFPASTNEACIFLFDLEHIYDGSAKYASVTTTPAGLTVEISYNGNANAPINSGVYTVTATVVEPNWYGVATGSLTIAKADQVIRAGRARTVYELDLLHRAIEAYHAVYGHYPPTTGNAYMDYQNLLGWNYYPPQWDHYVEDPVLAPLMPIWDAPHGLTYFLKLQFDYFLVPSDEIEAYTNNWRHYLDEIAFVNDLELQRFCPGLEEGGCLVYSNYWAGLLDPCGQLYVYQSQPPYQSYILYSHDPLTIDDQLTTNTVGLAATASSGLPVSFEVVSGPAIITESTNLSFTGTGSVSIGATQSGDANWNSAPNVLITFDVLIPCLLMYTAGSGGRVEGSSPQIVPQGGNGTWVEAIPDDGYRFVEWSDGLAINPRRDTNLVTDIAVMALFSDTSPNGIPVTWLEQYSLPSDGSMDFLHTGRGSFTVWQHWIAGTNPHDPEDDLRITEMSASASRGRVIRWRSVATRMYRIERGTVVDGSPLFAPLAVNISGMDGTSEYVDQKTVRLGPFLYRVVVEQ